MNDNNFINKLDSIVLERAEQLKIDSMIRDEKDLQMIADVIIEGTYKDTDIQRKDTLDHFLDYVMSKVRTGSYYIPSLAYPTRRMADKELEDKVIKLINIHLYPEIVLPILKFFARNVKDSDKNLFLAYLINSDEIIKSIFDTFVLFKKDIFNPDKDKRTLNVKRIQQFPPTTENQLSSPLDAASRFKYILEFIALKQNVEHIYTPEQTKLSA
ncbi:MAG: hypothetical protein JW864_17835 [Spirochaetes bacterium]|nr:hypothetical protein [Spirochaetota bacterium]